MRDYSPHAARRTAQRSVSEQLVEFALAWGRPIHQRHGRTAYHLGRNEAAQARAAGVDVPERALDVTVVVAADGALVTVVRSQDRHRLRTHGRRARRGARR